MDLKIFIDIGGNMQWDLAASLTGEFWFGLNALHCLTSQGQWEARDTFDI